MKLACSFSLSARASLFTVQPASGSELGGASSALWPPGRNNRSAHQGRRAAVKGEWRYSDVKIHRGGFAKVLGPI